LFGQSVTFLFVKAEKNLILNFYFAYITVLTEKIHL